MSEEKYVGSKLVEEFRPGYHDRLSRFWPEPREQLHAGGWESTRRLVEQIGLDEVEHALDVCCGEGGTAVWLAGEHSVRVSGVDIVFGAVRVANQEARLAGVGHLSDFVRGNIFALSFAGGAFEVVYGQDADGFAHKDREVAFRECLRVLKPGGRFALQHWIPGAGAPRDLVARFDQINLDVGYSSHAEVHADAYLAAMRGAGFVDVQVEDRSEMYRDHMRGIADKAESAGETVEIWTATWLELAEEHPFGVLFTASKPDQP